MNFSPTPESDGTVPAAARSVAPACARVPFIIGVTGNMDPVGYDDDSARCWAAPEMVDFRARLFDILDWVTGLGKAADGRCLDPATGRLRPDATCEPDTVEDYHSCWKPFDLAKADGKSMTPVVILSSLAPGMDTLVVEVVLAYAKERGADLVVRCPLPFPAEIYERASSCNTEGRKARYREVLGKLVAEPWFDAGRDLFEVALANGLLPPGATAEGDLQADDAEFGKPRRYLRYRAAGEYVATHSDLLLAIHDVPFDAANANLVDRFEAGSSTIVESKRAGLSHELLAVSNNLAWADNGPVLVVPIHRQKTPKAGPDNSEGPPPPGRCRSCIPTIPSRVEGGRGSPMAIPSGSVSAMNSSGESSRGRGISTPCRKTGGRMPNLRIWLERRPSPMTAPRPLSGASSPWPGSGVGRRTSRSRSTRFGGRS